LRFNHAVLGKWLWQYGLERVVVDSKYGSSWGGWCSSEPIGAYGVGLLKNIRRGWGKLCSHTKFEVGDGSKVRFWHDIWCEDMAVTDAFLVLFGIACAKDALVEAHIDFQEVAFSGM
jgi:hypothetical protein